MKPDQPVDQRRSFRVVRAEPSATEPRSIAADPIMTKLLLREWSDLWRRGKHLEAFVALVREDLENRSVD